MYKLIFIKPFKKSSINLIILKNINKIYHEWCKTWFLLVLWNILFDFNSECPIYNWKISGLVDFYEKKKLIVQCTLHRTPGSIVVYKTTRCNEKGCQVYKFNIRGTIHLPKKI